MKEGNIIMRNAATGALQLIVLLLLCSTTASLAKSLSPARTRIEIQRALRSRKDIDKTDVQGQSWLHKAAACGLVSEAHILLRQRARINRADHYGNRPLHLAARHGQTAMVKALLKWGAAFTLTNSIKRTALQEAIAHGKHSTAAAIESFSNTALASIKAARVPSYNTHCFLVEGTLNQKWHFRGYSWELPNQAYYFKMTLKTFNRTTCFFTGEIEWPNLNALHTVAGYWLPESLCFRETSAIRRGTAAVGTVYRFDMRRSGSSDGSAHPGQWFWRDKHGTARLDTRGNLDVREMRNVTENSIKTHHLKYFEQELRKRSPSKATYPR